MSDVVNFQERLQAKLAEQAQSTAMDRAHVAARALPPLRPPRLPMAAAGDLLASSTSPVATRIT